MKFSRSMGVLIALCLIYPRAAFAAESASTDSGFVGTWRTTSATVTLLVSIHEDGTGQFVLIDDGANACEQVTWKQMPGGILVDSIPMLRFWRGRHADESRVEMEPLPAELTSRNLQQFPLAFMMRRDDGERHLPRELGQRPLPEGWTAATLPDDWDAKAGVRRNPPDAWSRRSGSMIGIAEIITTKGK